MNALCGLDVDLRAGSARAAEHHGVLAARALHELFAQILPDAKEDQQRHERAEDEAQDGRCGLLHLLGECRPGVIQPLCERGVVHRAGRIDLLLILVGKDDLIILDLDLTDVLLLDHAHERAVIDLFHLIFHQQRRDEHVEQQHDQDDDAVVVDQRFFR